MKNNVGLILLVIAMFSSVFAARAIVQHHRTEQQLYFLSVHCDNINTDFTRPDERFCINPISIEDNLFTFINKGGRAEQYLIIGMNGGASDINYNSFVYNFIAYKED